MRGVQVRGGERETLVGPFYKDENAKMKYM